MGQPGLMSLGPAWQTEDWLRDPDVHVTGHMVLGQLLIRIMWLSPRDPKILRLALLCVSSHPMQPTVLSVSLNKPICNRNGWHCLRETYLGHRPWCRRSVCNINIYYYIMYCSWLQESKMIGKLYLLWSRVWKVLRHFDLLLQVLITHWSYSRTCLVWPPLLPSKSGRSRQVVSHNRSYKNHVLPMCTFPHTARQWVRQACQ